MELNKMPKLKIGNLEPEIPVIQGGMSVGVSLSGLASAVANEGGIGVIGAASIGMLEPDFNKNCREANKRALRNEIRKTREKTDGIIGVNIMVALTDFEDLCMVAIEEGADVLLIGAGLALHQPKSMILEMAEKSSIKIVPIISSARAAKVIFKYWSKRFNALPDALVIEGPMAGGHLGFKRPQIDDPDYCLENILPDVIKTVKPFEEEFSTKIPLIAAGGIYTGADIYKFIQMGAQGVQMATRFAATHECDASIKFKQTYVECSKEDIVIIDSPVGLPGRAIKNSFIESVCSGTRTPFKCPWKCLKTCDFRKVPYCITLALSNAKKGFLKDGFVFAGSNAYRVDKIISVKELISTLIDEFNNAVRNELNKNCFCCS